MRTNPEFCYEVLQENFGSNKAEVVTDYLFEVAGYYSKNWKNRGKYYGDDDTPHPDSERFRALQKKINDHFWDTRSYEDHVFDRSGNKAQLKLDAMSGLHPMNKKEVANARKLRDKEYPNHTVQDVLRDEPQQIELSRKKAQFGRNSKEYKDAIKKYDNQETKIMGKDTF